MAERRMFAKTIIDSDAFLDMPTSSQLLYFHLSMRADDEGFINNPKSIMRNVGCKDDDVKLLIAKKFIIPFESGIVVIKHWKIHNYIQKDRFNETKYKDEKRQLDLDENKSYRLLENGMYTECIHDVSSLETQVRLGKDRLGKVRLEIEDKPTKHKHGEYNNVLLTDEELDKLQAEYPDCQERIDRLSGYIASTGKVYKSHYATIRQWAKRDIKQTKTYGFDDIAKELEAKGL